MSDSQILTQTDDYLMAMLSLSLVHTMSPAYTMAQIRQIYDANRPPIDMLMNDPYRFQDVCKEYKDDVGNIVIVDKSEFF